MLTLPCVIKIYNTTVKIKSNANVAAQDFLQRKLKVAVTPSTL
jgi:hypothetical protein